MTLEIFWNIVEKVHATAPRDMAAKCRLLGDALRRLPPAEIVSFDRHFADCLFRAYDWGLWGAAFVIADGCSDDSFYDFRSTLISMGRATFERALEDPDSLADSGIEAAWAVYEGYQYVAWNTYQDLTGTRLPNDDLSHPETPTGARFEEWALSKRFPKLTRKFRYKSF